MTEAERMAALLGATEERKRIEEPRMRAALCSGEGANATAVYHATAATVRNTINAIEAGEHAEDRWAGGPGRSRRRKLREGPRPCGLLRWIRRRASGKTRGIRHRLPQPEDF